MSSTPITQLPRNLMFRYRIACKRFDATDEMASMKAEHRLPVPGRFEGQKTFADWFVGWNEKGLRASVKITGKSTSLWCKTSQIMESDGVHLWIDTRDTHDIHRATRYCHWLMAMPTGGTGPGGVHASMLKINRAREDSPSINRAKLTTKSKITKTGYELDLFLPAASLNGWNPEEQPTIGFFMAVADRELGWQTMGVGPEMPIFEDPSLWQTLKLEK